MKFMPKQFVYLILVAVLSSGCGSTDIAKLRSSKIDRTEKAATALVLQPAGEFGRGLTSTEQSRMTMAESRALDYGKPGEKIEWTGERDDVTGTVTAFQPYKVGQSDCRRFTHDLLRKGTASQSSGTACRKENGPWQLIS